MWYAPEKYSKPLVNLNEEFLKLSGDLNDKEAKITLIKFLRANLSFTVELLTGIKLSPYQEVTLRGMLNRNFSMCVWGRGCGKTFVASVFCVLQCIFEPGTKILVAGPTFRTARFIFNNIEKICESRGAELLLQAFGSKSKRNDQYEWSINGGSIVAIPLNGEKIRGFRANVLVLDEYLLLSEDIIKTVLMPFLVAPQNMKERLEVRAMEDALITKGQMKEEERMVFENTSKMIALSSASYSFENLYKTYKEWTDKIYSPERESATYFISQMSWESLPEHMIDKTIIEEAQNGGTSHSSFQREYCAQFTDGSDSYFSAKKMHDCTIADGQEPTTQIVGGKGKKYILAIDPSFSNSPTSDFFAMAVVELDDEFNQSTLVHNYAVAGGDLKDHIKYLHYLVQNFDLEMIIIDNAGYQFIDAANESEFFRNSSVELKFFEFDSDKEGAEYEAEIKKVKRLYNKGLGVKVFKQVFTSEFIRKANVQLQGSIDHQKIWFASKTAANGRAFDKYANARINVELTGSESVLDLIEIQDTLIYSVKKQCALIEVKSTAKGTQTFDLPQHLKRSNSPARARKDNYTALMLANWAVKCYYDVISMREEQSNFTFVPFVIN
jgi:hypothetical protein